MGEVWTENGQEPRGETFYLANPFAGPPARIEACTIIRAANPERGTWEIRTDHGCVHAHETYLFRERAEAEEALVLLVLAGVMWTALDRPSK